MSSVDWDDLRMCLAVARHGTVSAAATSIGISHSTLLRRIAAFEERLGVVLFRRKANGYEINTAGARLIEAAEGIDGQITETLAEISGHDRRMQGAIKLTLPDASAQQFLLLVREFQIRHPDTLVHLDAAQSPASITLGDTHVAVALTDAAPQGQKGTPIGPVAFAAYMRASLLDKADVEALAWLGLAPHLQSIPVGRFDRRLSARFARVQLCGSVALHHAAIRSGLGLGLLACGVGDSDPDLVRVSPTMCDPELTLWVLHRRELSSNMRVLALYRFLRQALQKRRPLIAGDSPPRPVQVLPVFGPRAEDDVD